MTATECWAAISTLLGELKKRIKNREDIGFFEKLEDRYNEAKGCHQKEIVVLTARHAEEKERLAQEINDLRAQLNDKNAKAQSWGNMRPRPPLKETFKPDF